MRIQSRDYRTHLARRASHSPLNCCQSHIAHFMGITQVEAERRSDADPSHRVGDPSKVQKGVAAAKKVMGNLAAGGDTAWARLAGKTEDAHRDALPADVQNWLKNRSKGPSVDTSDLQVARERRPHLVTLIPSPSLALHRLTPRSQRSRLRLPNFLSPHLRVPCKQSLPWCRRQRSMLLWTQNSPSNSKAS